MTLGQHIKEERTKKGITQKQLADALGVTESYISQYERDLRNPKYETIKKIAKALDIPVTALYDGYPLDWDSEISNDGPGDDYQFSDIELFDMIRESNQQRIDAIQSLGFGVIFEGNILVFKEQIGKGTAKQQASLLLTLYQLNAQNSQSSEKKIRTARILMELVSVLSPEDQDKLISYAEYLDSDYRQRNNMPPVIHQYKTEK